MWLNAYKTGVTFFMDINLHHGWNLELQILAPIWLLPYYFPTSTTGMKHY